MKKKKWFIIAILLLLIVVYVVVFYNTKDNIVIGNKTSVEKQKKVYKHTLPNRILNNDYFKWEFISNNIASIYPRREAIVKDILVDIWDKVKIGETLAILFNPWVWWEWQSKINIKSTLLQTKRNLLWNIKEVKNAKLSEIFTKIIEKEIVLDETSKNFDTRISQFELLEKNKTSSQEDLIKNSQTKIDIEKNKLIILEQSLQDAISLKKEILKESENNILQKEKLLDKQINEILSKIIPIFYIWNESAIDYIKIERWDMSDLFWIKNSSNRNDLLQKINYFIINKWELNTLNQYNKLLEINNLLIIALQDTVISVDIIESKIKDNINAIQTYEISLLNYKENYDDSINLNNISIQLQNEKNSKIVTQIKLQKSVIISAESWYWAASSLKEEKVSNINESIKKLKSDKSLAISKMKAELDTLKKTKKLLEAQENHKVTSIQNDISVAKSNLNSEYIKSWDYKIISPFSWIISKRKIDIWEKISQNMEAFRLSWVDSTLSRITKKEVKFYIPENLQKNLKIWKDVLFYTWDNKTKSFTWTIYRISPEVDEDTLSIIVQAKVSDNVKLPNKSTIRVNLETRKEMFKIPSSTIYNKNERKIIYYKKDNWKLWIRDISIISDDWEYSLVSWNITDDLKIITTPIFIK